MTLLNHQFSMTITPMSNTIKYYAITVHEANGVNGAVLHFYPQVGVSFRRRVDEAQQETRLQRAGKIKVV